MVPGALAGRLICLVIPCPVAIDLFSEEKVIRAAAAEALFLLVLFHVEAIGLNIDLII